MVLGIILGLSNSCFASLMITREEQDILFRDGTQKIFWIGNDSEGLKLGDDIPFRFGDDADASIKYNTSTGKLEISGNIARLRRSISFALSGGATVKWIADANLTIVHISFYNQAEAAFTSASSVKNGANIVASSSADLAADTVEEKEGGDLSNTSVTDGAIITFIAGSEPTAIVITYEQ